MPLPPLKPKEIERIRTNHKESKEEEERPGRSKSKKVKSCCCLRDRHVCVESSQHKREKKDEHTPTTPLLNKKRRERPCLRLLLLSVRGKALKKRPTGPYYIVWYSVKNLIYSFRFFLFSSPSFNNFVKEGKRL